MSRTYKDKPDKLRWPEARWDWDCDRIAVEKPLHTYNRETGNWEDLVGTYTSYVYLQRPGVKVKRKRSYREWDWMNTPMWWIREMMNRPQRVAGKQWERKVVQLPIDMLEDEDTPSVGRKPHIYYW